MHKLVKIFGAGLAYLTFTAGQSAAQGAQETGDEAAFLFGYSARNGDTGGLVDGYKRHLEWHRERNDPLTWYGWFVIEGQRLGMFIDGSFGLSFADFDNRIDPAGDGADATETFLPVAQPEFRQVYRLRRDLSAATPLEDQQPTGLMQVMDVTLRAGRTAEFAGALSALAAAMRARQSTVRLTVYERITGGAQPGFMVTLAVASMAELGAIPPGLTALARSYLAGPGQRQALDALAASVAAADTELWQYRADLSLIPAGD